jgi:hypothetical protein
MLNSSISYTHKSFNFTSLLLFHPFYFPRFVAWTFFCETGSSSLIFFLFHYSLLFNYYYASKIHRKRTCIWDDETIEREVIKSTLCLKTQQRDSWSFYEQMNRGSGVKLMDWFGIIKNPWKNSFCLRHTAKIVELKLVEVNSIIKYSFSCSIC